MAFDFGGRIDGIETGVENLDKEIERRKDGISQEISIKQQEQGQKTRPKFEYSISASTAETKSWELVSGQPSSPFPECSDKYIALGPKLFSNFYGGDSIFDVLCQLQQLKQKDENLEFNFHAVEDSTGIQLSSYGDFGPLNEVKFEIADQMINVSNFVLGGITFDLEFYFINASPVNHLELYGFAWHRTAIGRPLSHGSPHSHRFPNLMFLEFLTNVKLVSRKVKIASERKILKKKIETLRGRFIDNLKERKFYIDDARLRTKKFSSSHNNVSAWYSVNVRESGKTSTFKSGGKTYNSKICMDIAQNPANWVNACKSFIKKDTVITAKWSPYRAPGLEINYRYYPSADNNETVVNLLRYTDDVIQKKDKKNTKNDTSDF